jgi:hypothetical protein
MNFHTTGCWELTLMIVLKQSLTVRIYGDKPMLLYILRRYGDEREEGK